MLLSSISFWYKSIVVNWESARVIKTPRDLAPSVKAMRADSKGGGGVLSATLHTKSYLVSSQFQLFDSWNVLNKVLKQVSGTSSSDGILFQVQFCHSLGQIDEYSHVDVRVGDGLSESVKFIWYSGWGSCLYFI